MALVARQPFPLLFPLSAYISLFPWWLLLRAALAFRTDPFPLVEARPGFLVSAGRRLCPHPSFILISYGPVFDSPLPIALSLGSGSPDYPLKCFTRRTFSSAGFPAALLFERRPRLVKNLILQQRVFLFFPSLERLLLSGCGGIDRAPLLPGSPFSSPSHTNSRFILSQVASKRKPSKLGPKLSFLPLPGDA